MAPPQTWVTRWFPPEELGTTQGFLISGYSYSGVIGILAMGFILRNLNLQTTSLYLGIICFMWTAVFILAGLKRELPPGVERAPEKGVEIVKEIKRVFTNAELWKVGMAWLFIVGCFTCYATFAPTTFKTLLGLKPSRASFIAGIASILAVPFHVLGGKFSDKLKPQYGRKILVWLPTSILIPGYFLVGIATSIYIAVLSIIMVGIFSWVSNGAAFSGAAESVDPAIMGFAFGFMSFTSSMGSVLLPLIMGSLLDSTGSWMLSWAFLAIMSFIGTIAGVTMKNHPK